MDHESKPKKLFGLFNLRSKRKTRRDSVPPSAKVPLTQLLPESPKSLPSSPRVTSYPAGPVDRMPHSQTWTHSTPSSYIEQGIGGDASSQLSLHEPRDIVGYRASDVGHKSQIEANESRHRVDIRPENGMRPSEPRLIVGIDFGTTSSGVAFAFTTEAGEREGIITEWPGAGNQSRIKVPTVVYYDQNQRVVGWGLEVGEALAPNGQPKPGVQKVEWFKLQLISPSSNYLDTSKLPTLPPGKSAVDVTADFLFQLRRSMRVQLKKILGEIVFHRHEANICYFLTVPAIWDDMAKEATRVAAMRAGFVTANHSNMLTLVSEPEAAAIFCVKSGMLDLRTDDAVLIVDCGGGTVDLISYLVETEKPFTLTECTAGSGDSCGSTAVNRNFSTLLRSRIAKMKLLDGSRVPQKVYLKCLADFENRIKAGFCNNGGIWAIDVGLDTDYPEAKIEEGYMIFTDEEILGCHIPVVERILELVGNQIIAIQSENRNLQNVLVVGGFGASDYVFQQIKRSVPPQFQPGVLRPMDSVAAIVRGAVTAGLIASLLTARVSRRHYLLSTIQIFIEGYHKESYRVLGPDGRYRCKHTRQIFLAKGQRIAIGEPVKISFFRNVAPGATLIYNDILYTCDNDVCPEYTTHPDIKPLVTLTSDLSRKSLERDFQSILTPQGVFYKVYFDIYLTLDGSKFQAELVCQGEVMGRCVAKFE